MAYFKLFNFGIEFAYYIDEGEDKVTFEFIESKKVSVKSAYN